MKRLLIIAVYLLISSVASAQKIITVTDYGIVPDSRISATENLKKAIADCRQGEAVVLRFPKGRYDFWGDQSTGETMVGISIKNINNLTVDGEGSEFVFHGRMVPFEIEGCENLTMKNFAVDWDRPLTSQATIGAVSDQFIDINIDRAAYPYVIEKEKLRFVGEGWKTKVVHYMLFDKDTKDVVTLTRDGALGDIFEARAEELSPGVVRLYGRVPFKPEIGTYIALYAQRELHGINMYLCKNSKLEDLKIHFSPGGGIFAMMCNGLYLNRVNVEANQAKGRVFSSMADATYFPNCRGVVRIENCKHTGQTDDWANFRGTYTSVSGVNSPNSINVKYKWERPDRFYNVGDEVHFVKISSMQREKELLVIKEVAVANDQEMRLTFESDLPKYVSEDYVVENMTWTPEVEVRNCVIPRQNRARGILLTTPRRAVFENNLFQTAGAAILLEGDTDAWYEAGAIRDFTIRNNVFENCMTSAEPGDWCWGEAVICITPSHKPTSANEEPYHQNIRIENNVFKYYDYNLLYARSVRGLTFINNEIILTKEYPMHGRKVNFWLNGCREVSIGGNSYSDDYPARNAELHNMVRRDLTVSRDEKIDVQIKK